MGGNVCTTLSWLGRDETSLRIPSRVEILVRHQAVYLHPENPAHKENSFHLCSLSTGTDAVKYHLHGEEYGHSFRAILRKSSECYARHFHRIATLDFQLSSCS